MGIVSVAPLAARYARWLSRTTMPEEREGSAAGLFQHGINIGSGGVPSGCESEEQARNKRDGERENQHGGINGYLGDW